MDSRLHSYHVFLLPFRWEPATEPAKGALWDAGLEGLLGSKWKADRFSLADKGEEYYTPEKRYNEYVYFHDFCRSILYDFDPAFRPAPAGNEKPFMRHYEYNEELGDYEIKLKGRETYRLKVNAVLANFYWMGVGVLSIHLENYAYSDPDDILKINQFGRRIYPPFLPLRESKGIELAESLGFTHLEPDFFDQYAEGAPGTSAELKRLPTFLGALFPRETVGKLSLLGDDRMFVHCLYEHAAESEKAKTAGKWAQKSNDFLYKFTFVDVKWPGLDDGPTFEKAHENHIYRRWSESGSFYGISRYSFVALMSPSTAPYLKDHVRTMYYKLVELSLVQRASILVFQEKVSHASGKEGEAVSPEVQALYEDYLRFVNKVYFKEVTAQEQGIELYDMLQKHMRIEDHVKNLEGEMRDLEEYVELIAEKRRNDRLDLLTRVGAGFLIPTFVAGYLGMNVFDGRQLNDRWYWSILIMVIFPLLSMLLFNGKGKTQWWKLLILGLVVVAALIALPQILFTESIKPCP